MGKPKRDGTTPVPRPAIIMRLVATPEKIAFAKLVLKLVGKLGLRQVAAMVRNAETRPPKPPAPTPKPRQPGGGRHPKFKPEQQQWLRARYWRDLKKDQRLVKQDTAAVPHVKKLAKDKYGIQAGRNTLIVQIIRPVLLAAKKNQK
jgi:hypothetical protein